MRYSRGVGISPLDRTKGPRSTMTEGGTTLTALGRIHCYKQPLRAFAVDRYRFPSHVS